VFIPNKSLIHLAFFYTAHRLTGRLTNAEIIDHSSPHLMQFDAAKNTTPADNEVADKGQMQRALHDILHGCLTSKTACTSVLLF